MTNHKRIMTEGLFVSFTPTGVISTGGVHHTGSTDHLTGVSLLQETTTSFTFKVCFISALMTVGILGNLFTMATVTLIPSLNKPGNYFYVNLAVADFIVSGISMPIILSNILRDKYAPISTSEYEKSYFCQASAYLKTIAVHVSCYARKPNPTDHLSAFVGWYSLAFTAISFYCNVCRQSGYKRYFKKENVLKIIAITWIWVLIINFGTIVGWKIPDGSKADKNTTRGVYKLYPKANPPVMYDGPSHGCVLGISGQGGYAFANGFFVIILPLFSIIFSYSRVFITVIKSRRKLQSTMGNEQLKKRYREEAKTFVMLVAVVVVFMICWVPTMIYGNLSQHPLAHPAGDGRLVTNWLALSNSSIKPILYGFLNMKFREGYITLLKRLIRYVSGRRCYHRLREFLRRKGFTRKNQIDCHGSKKRRGRYSRKISTIRLNAESNDVKTQTTLNSDLSEISNQHFDATGTGV